MKNLATTCLLVAELILSAGVVVGCGRSSLDDARAPAGSGGSTGVGVLPTVGLPPSPGFFRCGVETCQTATQQCCLGVATGGGLGASCARLGSTCVGAALQCDEPADCASSALAVCCFGLDSSSAPSPGASGVSIGSRCESAASCAGLGHFILCAVNSDCGPKGGVCCASVGIPTCQPSCPGL